MPLMETKRCPIRFTMQLTQCHTTGYAIQQSMYNDIDNSTMRLYLHAPLHNYVYVIGNFTDWRADVTL